MTHTSTPPSPELRDYAAARFALPTRLEGMAYSPTRDRTRAAVHYLDSNERMTDAEKTERIGELSRALDSA